MTLFVYLLLSALAHAGPTYPLTPMSAEECAASLREALEPESAIKEGLDALASLNIDRSSALSCFTELTNEWDKNFPLSGGLPNANPLQTRMDELIRRTYCFIPKDYQANEETLSYYKKTYGPMCGNTWLSKAELAEINKQKEEVSKELAEQNRNLFFLKRIPYVISGQDFERRSKEISVLQAKLKCRPNPYAPGEHAFKAHQNLLEVSCGGKELSLAELEKIESEANKLQLALDKDMAEASALASKLTNIFSGAPLMPSIEKRMDSLLPAVRKAACTNPYSAGSYQSQDWSYKMSSQCKGEYGNPDELGATVKNLLAELGNIDELAAIVATERKQAEAKAKAAERAFALQKAENYGRRRLYGFYGNFLKAGREPNDIATFCETYAQGMLREKAFAETTLPDGKRAYFFTFGGDAGWQRFAKYGVSEAEYSVLAAYVGNLYLSLNPPLYESKLTPATELYRDTLNSALDKMPTYSGEPLLRFATLTEDVLAKHQAGDLITYDSFTSTSKKKGWNWGGNAVFLIYPGKNGKDLGEFNAGEQEVLFKAGTRFKVVAKQKANDKTHFILVEVDEAGAPMAKIVPPAGSYEP